MVGNVWRVWRQLVQVLHLRDAALLVARVADALRRLGLLIIIVCVLWQWIQKKITLQQ